MGSAGRGDVEFVIFLVGLVVTVVLLVVTVVAAVGRSGTVRVWLAGCAAAVVVTVGLLSVI